MMFDHPIQQRVKNCIFSDLIDWWRAFESKICDADLTSNYNEEGLLRSGLKMRSSKQKADRLLNAIWEEERSVEIGWWLGDAKTCYLRFICTEFQVSIDVDAKGGMGYFEIPLFDLLMTHLDPVYAYRLKTEFTIKDWMGEYFYNNGLTPYVPWKRETQDLWLPFAVGWRQAVNNRTYATKHIRDALPWSYLNQNHVSLPIDGTTFASWIEAGSGSNGDLQQVKPDRWVWTVPPEQSERVRDDLAESGIVPRHNMTS